MVNTQHVINKCLGKNNKKPWTEFDIKRERVNAGTASKEETEEFFLGQNPKKHKDFKHFSGK